MSGWSGWCPYRYVGHPMVDPLISATPCMSTHLQVNIQLGKFSIEFASPLDVYGHCRAGGCKETTRKNKKAPKMGREIDASLQNQKAIAEVSSRSRRCSSTPNAIDQFSFQVFLIWCCATTGGELKSLGEISIWQLPMWNHNICSWPSTL